ncbi:MAG TPA: Ig-like domain-containing protein, partial [Nonomuraea sp.]|nr:Ig-like domain-containing protein [Nonomuraea sp.]
VGTLTAAPYSFAWDSRSGSDGTAVLTSKAYDRAGNATTSASLSVTVDNTAPNVAITSPQNGNVVFNAVTITANAADNASVTKVEFYDGGALIGTDTTAPYSISYTAPLGRRDLTAKAYDPAGNVRTSATVSVTVL